MSFLDVFVSKTSEISRGHLAWKPFFKPTSQHLPLACDSGHAPPIHSSWPKAEILRMSKRSSSEIAFLRAKDHLCGRWQSGFLDPSIIDNAKSITFSALRGLKPKARMQSSRVLWLVLPYFPCWFHRDLFRHVADVVSKYHTDVASVLRSDWSLRISWKNISRNLFTLLRSI